MIANNEQKVAQFKIQVGTQSDTNCWR